MGYRSEVAIRVEIDRDNEKGLTIKDIYEDLCQRATSAVQLDFVVKYIDSISIDEDKGVLTLAWSDVKWYREFEEVKLIEKWLNDLSECVMYFDSEDDELQDTPEILELFGLHVVSGFHFIRLGEDYDDFEERYEGYLDYPISVVRYIDYENY